MWHYNYGPYLEHGFKYIKRYQVDGKWRYVYADKQGHDKIDKNSHGHFSRSEHLATAENERKMAREYYNGYNEKRQIVTKYDKNKVSPEFKEELKDNTGIDLDTFNHLEASKKYRLSKMSEASHRSEAAKYEQSDKDYRKDIANNEVTWSNAVNAGKKLIEKLKKKKK